MTLLQLIGVVVAALILIALLLPARRSAGPAARRAQCMNHLKNIAVAVQYYQSVHGGLPPAYTVDANGKPLHSWRTLILPGLDQASLYRKIDLSKPWDDPANAEAFQTAISVYRCPDADGPANHTGYLAVVAVGGCFRPTESRLLSEITDKHSETLMLIEVDASRAVPWMEPRDADEELILDFQPTTRLAHPNGVHGALVDGSIRHLEATLTAAERRALISISGNDNP